MPDFVQLNGFVIFQIITGLVNVFLLFYVIVRFLQARAGQAYLPIALSITLWSITDLFGTSSPNLTTASFWQRMGVVPAIFVAPALLNFVLAISHPNFLSEHGKRIFLFLPSVILTILIFATPIFDLRAVPSPWGYNVADTPSYLFFGFFVSIMTMSAIALGLGSLHRLNDLQKTQMKFFLVGFSIPLIGGIITEVVAPAYNIQMLPMTSSLSGITGLVIIYAIQKYEFLAISPSMALEQIFNTIHDAVFAVNTKGNIVLANAQAAIITGYDPADLIGTCITTIVRNRDNTDTSLDSLLNQPINNLPMTIRTKQGVSISTQLTGTTIQSAGIIQGIVLVARDMSQTDELIRHLKEKTKELETSKQTLEQTVQDTKKLNEMMVGRELKMAELKKRNEYLESQGKPA